MVNSKLWMIHYKVKLPEYIGAYEGDITISTTPGVQELTATNKAAQKVKDLCVRNHIDLEGAELELKVTSSVAM